MNCIRCNKETTNPKFCGRSCAATYNNIKLGQPRHGHTRPPCNQCGKTISQYGGGKYCTLQCHVDSKWEQKIDLIKNDKQVSAVVLRKYLLIIKPNCVECGIGEEYNGKPLTLEMDHIDGDSTHNMLDNVRLLCPNCHSQTPTYKAKNIHNVNGAEKERNDT